MSTALARLRWSDLVRQEAGRWVGDLECDWLLWEHTGYPVFWQKDPQAECRAQLRAFFDAAERGRGVPGPHPECGKDFCDGCGDCLSCNGSDPCHAFEDGVHLWEVEPGVFVGYPTMPAETP